MIFDQGRALLDRGFSFLGFGTAVYRPQSGDPITVQVKRGRTVFRYLSSSGQTVRTVAADFLFRRADLPAEPRNGDRVEFAGDTYLVTAPNREPCWCWHGSDRDTYRVHAKKLEGAAR